MPAAVAGEPHDRALHAGVDERVVGREPREALLDRAARDPAPGGLAPHRADAAVVADERAVLHLHERALAGAARDALVLPGAAAVVAVDVAAERGDDEPAGLRAGGGLDADAGPHRVPGVALGQQLAGHVLGRRPRDAVVGAGGQEDLAVAPLVDLLRGALAGQALVLGVPRHEQPDLAVAPVHDGGGVAPGAAAGADDPAQRGPRHAAVHRPLVDQVDVAVVAGVVDPPLGERHEHPVRGADQRRDAERLVLHALHRPLATREQHLLPVQVGQRLGRPGRGGGRGCRGADLDGDRGTEGVGRRGVRRGERGRDDGRQREQEGGSRRPVPPYSCLPWPRSSPSATGADSGPTTTMQGEARGGQQSTRVKPVGPRGADRDIRPAPPAPYRTGLSGCAGRRPGARGTRGTRRAGRTAGPSAARP